MARNSASPTYFLRFKQVPKAHNVDFEDGCDGVQEMLDRIDALEVMAGEEKALQRALERLNARVGAVQAAVETHATIGART